LQVAVEAVRQEHLILVVVVAVVLVVLELVLI
jgi:hypothetical protein